MENVIIYNKTSTKMQERMKSKLLELLHVKNGDVIVEIGCGSGKLAVLLSDKVGITGKVIGIDPDKGRIAFAHSQYEHKTNLKFIKCKSTEFPIEQGLPYDSVVCNKTLHWINTNDKIETFNRIHSSLKPGGLFVGNINFKMPVNVELMISLLTSAEQKEIYSWYDRESIEVLKRMFLESGFEILYYKEEKMQCPIGDIETYLEWITSAFFGKFDFKNAHKTRKYDIDFKKGHNGNILHHFDGIFYSVKKTNLVA